MLASIWTGLFAVLFIVTCCLLVIVVLLQKGRGGGLGAAFGGAGSAAFGTRTGDVFTWITIVLTALFLLLAVGASFAYRESSGKLPMPIVIEESQDEGVKRIMLKAGGNQKNVKVCFTLDGTEPMEHSPQYKSVLIDLKQGQTLKARSFKYNWEPSELAVKTWELPATSTAPASNPAEAQTAPASRPQTTQAAPAAPVK